LSGELFADAVVETLELGRIGGVEVESAGIGGDLFQIDFVGESSLSTVAKIVTFGNSDVSIWLMRTSAPAAFSWPVTRREGVSCA
jgi:hypothetical protein